MLLITGASGYLGSELVRLAARSGRDVRALVRDPRRADGLFPPGVDIVIGDLSDPDALARAARGCTGVLHTAATVGGSAEEMSRVNVDGTAAVLAAARSAGVPRVVCTSTAAAIMDASGLVAEDPVGPPALTDPYSASKAAAEKLALAADGVDAVLVNPVSI